MSTEREHETPTPMRDAVIIVATLGLHSPATHVIAHVLEPPAVLPRTELEILYAVLQRAVVRIANRLR